MWFSEGLVIRIASATIFNKIYHFREPDSEPEEEEPGDEAGDEDEEEVRYSMFYAKNSLTLARRYGCWC